MNTFLSGAGVDVLPVLLLMVGMWLASLWRRDASIMDIAWGPGFVLIGVTHALVSGLHARGAMVLALVTLWGLRLAWHIGARHQGREDARYRRWRERHGSRWALRSLFTVFLFQGVLMWLLARPLVAALRNPQGYPGWPDLAGLVIAVAGLLLETIADAQMKAHRASGQGGLCVTGAWRYSRHPNYFGEAVFWWGIFLLAWAAGGAWTVFAPVLMTVLLRYVSGVPLLEAGLRDRPGWSEYARRTPAFIPWRPRP